MSEKKINKFLRDLNVGSIDIDKTINTFHDDATINRGEITRRDNDVVKDPSVGFEDIDYAVKSFLETRVKPSVEQDGKAIPVPVEYANQEKWASIRSSGYMRDEKGKLIAPAIVFNRVSVSRNPNLMFNKILDNDSNRMVFKKKYNRNNYYDKFSLLYNSKPVEEYYSIEVPDYVDVSYQMIIWCDFTTQLNKLVEQMLYWSNHAWGEKYKFIVKADSFNFISSDASGEDRVIRATGDFSVKGYLVHKDIGKDSNMRKFFSKSKIVITEAAVTDKKHKILFATGSQF